MNNNEETRIEINDKKPKKLGYYNWPWTKTKRALGIKAVLGRMIYFRKKNCSIHYATNNWMILIGDGKTRGYQMMNEKITGLDQLIFLGSQAMRAEATKMEKTKVNNEGWITIGKKM